jgi:cyclic dehypoxanthinyl futalosine synthase
LEERIEHLLKIRGLQDETQGFRAFIPWTLSPQGTPRMSRFRPAGGEDYLKTVAISRLMLDNIEHVQSGWLTEGLKLGQIALAFGCDDMGGTLLEDKVLEPTGIQVKTRREDLVRLIREAGFLPAQRDTNYRILHVCN